MNTNDVNVLMENAVQDANAAGHYNNEAINDPLSIINQIRQFKSAPVIPFRNTPGDVTSDPLEWWKANEHLYPTLALLAMRRLCIPATSAPAERVFSLAGITIANDRAQLTHENAADCIFLRQVLPALEELEE